MSLTRRDLLVRAGAASAFAALPAPLRAATPSKATRDPFSLGVASGSPVADGVVLWTRLAPEPLFPGGGMDPVPVRVEWEIARDETFASVVRKGVDLALPEWGHSVHVEADGLEPERWYFYRFRAGAAVSPVGRTRTASARGKGGASLKVGVASCQHWEQGHFASYRDAVAAGLDLFLHVGDYIYESSWGDKRIRSHGAPAPVLLDDYRARYGLYKGEPNLRAAHAAMPWLVTPDDHEVENDWAGPISQFREPEPWFLARRMNAFQAWYEHMPVRRGSVPLAGFAHIFGRHAFGDLATFHVLDDRQFRSPQACPRPGRQGSRMVRVEDCPNLDDPTRTLLGPVQEPWLFDGLARSKATWNVVVQQTLVADVDRQAGPGREVWTDGWTGYPVARRRLLEHLRDSKAANPVFVGGDVHSFWVADLKPDFADPKSPVVASEFCGTSITAEAGEEPGAAEKYLSENPHLKYGNVERNGWLRVDLSPKKAEARLVAVKDKFAEVGSFETLATYVVEAGRPGPQKA